MTLNARIRFCLAAVVLATGYFYLLVYLIGWMAAHHWPSWWFDIFPSRHVGSAHPRFWSHCPTQRVLCGRPLPIRRPLAVIIVRRVESSSGLRAHRGDFPATFMAAIAPPDWHAVNICGRNYVSGSQPVFFVTDNIKR